ncbi:MAG: HAD family hydrolase [Eubacteriales bacterium]
MIKGAIFDMDGTLLDSMYIWRNFGEIYLRSRGIEPQKDTGNLYRKYGYRRASEFFRDEFGLDVCQEDFIAEARAILQQYYEDEVGLKPGVGNFLERMRGMGVEMCLATATDEVMVRPAFKRLGIEGYFSGILTCAGVGRGKTDPLIYRRSLELLGTEKSKTPVFEDAFYAAKTAKNDGFVLAGVWDENEDEREAVEAISDIFIRDYLDLSDYWKTVETL